MTKNQDEDQINYCGVPHQHSVEYSQEDEDVESVWELDFQPIATLEYQIQFLQSIDDEHTTLSSECISAFIQEVSILMTHSSITWTENDDHKLSRVMTSAASSSPQNSEYRDLDE